MMKPNRSAYGVVLILGLFLGAAPASGQAVETAEVREPEWLTFDRAVSRTAVSGKRLMIYVQAEWCTWCRKLEREVFGSEPVRDQLARSFEVSRLDLDDQAETYRYAGRLISPSELADLLGAESVPAVIFLEPDGTYLTRIEGFVDEETFTGVLDYLNTKASADR